MMTTHSIVIKEKSQPYLLRIVPSHDVSYVVLRDKSTYEIYLPSRRSAPRAKIQLRLTHLVRNGQAKFPFPLRISAPNLVLEL